MTGRVRLRVASLRPVADADDHVRVIADPTGPARTTIRAAGGVVWRRDDEASAIQVALVHRPRYDDWSLPKGKVATGESNLQAAVREIAEETGFEVDVGTYLGETRYRKSGDGGDRSKRVLWWAMRVAGGEFQPTPEVDRLEWIDLSDARRKLTKDSDRRILRRFARLHRTARRSSRGGRTAVVVLHGQEARSPAISEESA